MNKHSGSCLCKKASFEILADFNGFFLCHCSRCQKDSGTAHASNLFSKDGELKWVSGFDSVRTFQLPNTRFMTTFCLECGSALPTVEEDGTIMVPAGSLDTSLNIRPNAHIYYGSKAGWEHYLDSIIKHEELPSK